MKPLLRLIALGVFLSGSLGNVECDHRTPTIACDDIDMTVLPGTQVEISNPCADHQWLDLPRVDGMTLDIPPWETPGVGIITDRAGPTIRSLAVAEGVELFVGRPFAYIYGRGREIGRGVLRLSTVVPVSVTARADPAVVAPGGAVQLISLVSGGVQPYTFSWSPADSLDAANVQNPIATPHATTTYQLTVSDAGGQFARVDVPVNVNVVTTVAAFPPLVTAGDASQLVATADGGVPPYSFEWSPAGSLDDPNVSQPTARPLATTTFSVTITDASGYRVTRAVTVTVIGGGRPALTADFAFTWDGFEGLALDASASTGDIVFYAWDFSWEPLSPDVWGRTPAASFYANEDTVGTITLTVTDATGARTSMTKSFPGP